MKQKQIDQRVEILGPAAPERKLTHLTQKQEFALEAFAKIHGRTWKSVLRDAWMNGNYPYGSDSASLQQVRNAFGPSWLADYRLPKPLLTSFKAPVVKVSDRSLDIPTKEQI